MSPDKKNFEALSRQFSKSTVADIQYKSINKTENTLSPVTASLKKIAGNFNINMNLRSERVLPQSLTRPGQEVPTVLNLKAEMQKGAQKASYLKNIAHLNIPKKAKQ